MCPLAGVDTSSLLKMNSGNPEIIYIAGDCYQWMAVSSLTVVLPNGQRNYSTFNLELVEVDCPGLGSGGNNTGGGGGGGGTPTNPVFNTPGANNPGGPAPNPGGVAGGPDPRKPVVTKPVRFLTYATECKKIADAMDKGTYRQQITAMATQVNDVVNEHGIILNNNDTITVLTPGPQISISGNGTGYRAIHHIHNNPPGGTYSIFSYEDIEAILQLLQTNKIDAATFVATLSTKKGTHYAMTIADIEKFKDFFFHEFNVFSNLNSQPDKMKYSTANEKEEMLKKKYFDNKVGLIRKENINKELMLGTFINFMKEADMGIMLYETDATFQFFDQINKTNKNDMTDFKVTRTKCK